MKRYRAAVLKAAVEGRVVPSEAELARADGRSYDSGDDLLRHILVSRRTLWEAKNPDGQYSHPVSPVLDERAELPPGWAWASVEQLSDERRSITYGVIKLGEHDVQGVPTLRSSNVRHLRLDLAGVKCIAPALASQYRRTELGGGEILVTVRGTLGGVVVAPATCRGFNVSREVAVVALTEPALAHTLAMFIGAPPVQHWLTAHTRGIAYTGINIRTLKDTPVPLPPLVEVHRISAEVERRLSIADDLHSGVVSSLRRAAALRQSILRSAFEGQLVQQDAADEPAVTLLDRIRHERQTRTARHGKRHVASEVETS